MYDMTFNVVENEIELRMEQLRQLDAEYASGNLYPPCPRCDGDRTIEVITRLNGEYFPPRIETLSCPLCSATGEAEAERAEEWLLEQVEGEELSEDDENYLEERKNIA